MKLRGVVFSSIILSAMLCFEQNVQAEAISNGNSPSQEQQLADNEIGEDQTHGQYNDVSWNIVDGVLTISGGTLPEQSDGPGNYIEHLWGGTQSERGEYIYSVPIRKIVIEDKLTLPVLAGVLFKGMTELTEIEGIENIDVSQTKNLYQTFARNKLKRLDLSSWNFNPEILESVMIIAYDMDKLEELDISSLPSESDTYMYPFGTEKFPNCYPLKNLKRINLPVNGLLQGEGNQFYLPEKEWIKVADKDNPTEDEIDGVTSTSEELFDGKHSGWWIVKPTLLSEDYLFEITIQSNLGDVLLKIPADKLPKYVDDIVTVEIQQKEGYSLDITSARLKATSDGLVVVDENDDSIDNFSVIYTKDDEITPEKPTDPSKPTVKVENHDKFLTIHPTANVAELRDDNLKMIDDFTLANNTDWYTDKIKTVGTDVYYRVATDKWVKASDAYLYQSKNQLIKTRAQDITFLVNSKGNPSKTRGLGKFSIWKSDKEVNINGQKYYRVATDEFVLESEVDVF